MKNEYKNNVCDCRNIGKNGLACDDTLYTCDKCSTQSKEIIIDQDVVYVGEGDNPKDDPAFKIWEQAYKEVLKENNDKTD